jgi:DnaJ-class molecular chaperone
VDVESLQQWLSVLDNLSYYDLFRVPQRAGADELRYAFYQFADTFHPDGHAWRSQWEREVIGRIFRRGTEAYRILSDPELRARYDHALSQGVQGAEQIVVESAQEVKKNVMTSGRLIDKIKSPAARPFVIRAEELLSKGDPKQAKIQLTMALHLEVKNPALDEFKAKVEAAVKAKDDEAKKNWSKKP